MVEKSKSIRVLSIDGGGMRGLYTARYLAVLADHYARKRGVGSLDIGRGFDLIVGTSTGAIIGCALAAGVDLNKVAELYRRQGPSIFPVKLPSRLGWNLVRQVFGRPAYLAAGAKAMESALRSTFGATTIADLWDKRRIALAVPAVEMSRHHSWVFKTPHLPNNRHRDDDYTLADICLAATAAPVYRSMARLRGPSEHVHHVFVDGGLWANSPVLVGLLEALALAHANQAIEIFSLGTCPRPEGDHVKAAAVNRGFLGWRFGGEVVTVSLGAQEYAFGHMARLFSKHVDRKCQIVRFPQGPVPAKIMQYLDLDETRTDALDAMESQATRDVDETLSRTGDESAADGGLLHSLLMEIPPTEESVSETQTSVPTDSGLVTLSQGSHRTGGSNA